MNYLSLKRIALSALALLAVGVAGATEDYYGTYDFVKAGDGSMAAPIYGSTVTTGGAELQLISYGDDSFNNLFAVGPKIRNNGTSNGFIFRTSGDYKGLWSQYDNRNFSIIGLKKGDRVTITISNKDETLKFVGGSVVVSGTTYTAGADGNMDFVSTGGVYIEKVVIAEPLESEKVTVGVVGTDKTYNFTGIDGNPINQDASHYAAGTELYMLALDDNDFDNMFAVGPKSRTGDGGFYFRNVDATYKGLYSQWEKREFSILNLKKGDKVTLTLSNNSSNLKFVDGDAVVSGQEYTAASDGNMNFVSTGSVYIETVRVVHPSQNIGGATLVSTHGLDFTGLGVEAYIASAAGEGKVTLTQVNKVPANTPLYLKAEAAVSVDVPIITADFDVISTNLLKGSASEKTSLTSTDDVKYYVFGVKDDVAGFYPVSSDNAFTSAAGKAYLQLTAAQAAAASRMQLRFEDGNNATGIATVKSVKAEGIYYNLSGQRVEHPLKGLYIVDGKKVFVK